MCAHTQNRLYIYAYFYILLWFFLLALLSCLLSYTYNEFLIHFFSSIILGFRSAHSLPSPTLTFSFYLVTHAPIQTPTHSLTPTLRAQRASASPPLPDLTPPLCPPYTPPAAITLFEVFLHLLMEHREHPEEPFPSVWASIPVVVEDILK